MSASSSALVLSTQLGWWWIDPAIGLAIAVFIAGAALRVGKDALDMLMDREMDEADRTRIKEIVRAHPAGAQPARSAHARVGP